MYYDKMYVYMIMMMYRIVNLEKNVIMIYENECRNNN